MGVELDGLHADNFCTKINSTLWRHYTCLIGKNLTMAEITCIKIRFVACGPVSSYQTQTYMFNWNKWVLEAFLPSQNSRRLAKLWKFHQGWFVGSTSCQKMKHSWAKVPLAHPKKLSTRKRNKQGIFCMIKVTYSCAKGLKCRPVIALSSAMEKSFWRSLFSYMCVLKCLSFFKHVIDVRLHYVVLLLWVEN